ncbi:hypothetical protein KGF56_003439 [Candida oxycetoniae]|uniref:Uncharacterized protein n=1 Tax=Candida oxycetoniae TaxID=497107 RepID=A0AAI9WXA6_9ASCO|nr:uncharacterized protein KGF56_003439 [Candida oxycetoniae]KAI3403804.1 hypothetical protein KGF56_003439 [Candida oxycetoniae]
MSSTTNSSALESPDQTTFQYANECDLEIHCSPFGLSGLYIRLGGTNIMGIGSTMGLITGSTKGLIHYNNSNDFIDKKFKLYIVVEDSNLRIDFTAIKEEGGAAKGGIDGKEEEQQQEQEENNNEEEEVQELPTLIFKGPCPEGRPDNIEPFIGIFSFERETV